MPAAPRSALNVCTLCATLASGGERSIGGCCEGPCQRGTIWEYTSLEGNPDRTLRPMFGHALWAASIQGLLLQNLLRHVEGDFFLFEVQALGGSMALDLTPESFRAGKIIGLSSYILTSTATVPLTNYYSLGVRVPSILNFEADGF